MSKAFTKEDGPEHDDDDTDVPDILPRNLKNYMTPTGAEALQKELRTLLYEERPKIVEIVAWAAGNGDRSENGDYIYGKKRLREIDRRVRYLTKRLDTVEIVDPVRQQHLKQVFFGATVTYAHDDDSEHTVTLVGVDEADASTGRISWLSPMAKALLKASVGDRVALHSPAGSRTLEIVAIRYIP
jgi:transcription elongation factor GreB